MPKYYTGEPLWEEGNSAFDAKRGDDAFRRSGAIKETALRIAGDPRRYRLSEHLGHSCLVVVRESHP